MGGKFGRNVLGDGGNGCETTKTMIMATNVEKESEIFGLCNPSGLVGDKFEKEASLLALMSI